MVWSLGWWWLKPTFGRSTCFLGVDEVVVVKMGRWVVFVGGCVLGYSTDNPDDLVVISGDYPQRIPHV